MYRKGSDELVVARAELASYGARLLDDGLAVASAVEGIPPGQGSARLAEIRATAAGTAAGAGVDLAKPGASVLAVGAIGDDLLGDMVAAAMARHGWSRRPGQAGALVAVDVLHPGRGRPDRRSRGRGRPADTRRSRWMTEHATDRLLRDRARAVIPGGMYGHQSATSLPPAYPQFMRGGRGARVWDVDGNEYVDLMCSYGPVVLGHRHPRVEAAVTAQAALGDCQNGPGPAMVDLAELLVRTVRHADWAMFAKNGTDATTMCCTIARAQTGRRKILAATGAYHGAAPWCTPRPAGTTPEDRANLGYYTYRQRAAGRRRGRRRPGGHRGQPVQARRRARPGTG
jgi:hypothetical protein